MLGTQLKVVNIVPVPTIPAGMYRTGMYIGIETSIFRTGLNTDHTDQFQAILASTEHTGRYINFFLIFLKFCNF